MRKAYAYAPPRSTLSGKAALIHNGIETAFTLLADLDIRLIGDEMGSGPTRADRPLPGLVQVSDTEPVIALGRTAHLALSNVRKRTLVAEDLERDVSADADSDETLETLVWSSVNTTKIVALGRSAWQSIQLLPAADRRFYSVPPLRLGQVDLVERGVLVLNHGESDARALALAAVLDRAGFEVRCAGRPFDVSPSGDWADRSKIHVHVGAHGLDAEEMRLVDSWHSERLVIQLCEDRVSRAEAEPSILAIEDSANGFVCATPDDVVTICNELLEDRVLQRKLIAGGNNSVAPLLKVWQAIAEDLIA